MKDSQPGLRFSLTHLVSLETSVSLLEVRKSDVCFSDILDLRQSTSTMNSKQYDVPVPILVFLVIAMSFHGVTSNSLYS